MVRYRMLSKWVSLIGKFLAAAGYVSLLLLTLPVRAQAQPNFSSVKINLLPEYDQPSVLVIYQMELAPATPLPVQMKLNLPSKAVVWAVAMTDGSGTLVDLPHTSQANGDGSTLSFTSTSLSVHVEFYEPLAKNGVARHIAYTWPGEYAVNALSVDFQMPLNATGLALVPPSVASGTDQGFTHYQTASVSLAAGQTFNLTADYQKPDDALSATAALPASPQPVAQNKLTKFWNANRASLLLGTLGALMLVGGLMWLVFWQKGRRLAPARPRHTRPSVNNAPSQEVVYCSQCGKLADPGDVFCRECGTRLRWTD
jgi:hypothetical protein